MRDTKVYRLLFTLLLACTTLTGWGQGRQASYPVRVMTQLTPPYSLILSDYSRPASQKLFITIMVSDLNIVNLPVRLHIKMETLSGMTVETIPNIITPAIYLTGGLVTMLYGTDLTDYFNINNLQFKGYSKEDYRRTGQLPEGHYRFTVEVRHWATGRIISSQGTAYTWMALGKPPILKVPEDKAEMGKIPGMPLTFSWIPNKVGIPGVIPQYKFEMWEMRIPDINPNVIAASLPPFYTTTQLITNLVIHPATLNFEPGMEYAWRVTAFDPLSNVPFEQGGHSVIRTFTYQCKCEGVTNVNLERKGRNVAVSWQQIPNKHTSFHLEMENQASGWSATDVVYYNKANSGILVEGQTYRMRVRAICDGNTMNPSEPTAWQTITIPDPPKRDNSKCGQPVKSIPVTNYTLRTDLQAGDFLTHPKSGGSRYTIKTATPQGDGKFKGIFVSWWGWAGDLKIPCEYWDLSVNTDNQILTMKYHSISKAAFLLDVDAAKAKIETVTDAVGNLTNAAADAVAKLTTNTQVKDSVKINAPLKGAYINEDKQLVVVEAKPDGTLVETVQPTGKMAATLVQGSDGEEYVVTSDGKMMGEKEFAATGGNSRMMNEHNKEKEAKAVPSVTFMASSEQKYGFDSYTENKSAIQNEYPELKAGYRPPFKSIESFKTDKVQTNNTDKDVTFRTEMGVPVTESSKTLTVRGSYDGDEQALYAYAGKDEKETVVGKLNVLSFDTKKKKVYLVSVNGATLPNAMTLQQELDRIYAPAVVSWAVANANAVSVTFAKGKMTHGGSGLLTVYNADQKAVIKAFGNMEKDALYLFFVNSVQGKEGVNGYMPMQYQSGFIYDNINAVTVAHELAHGAFNLAHTFSSEKFIAAQGSSDNLLDYKGGAQLWKHQWKLVNNPQSMFLKFLQDEEDVEMNQNIHLALTPDGNLMDEFYLLDKKLLAVTLYVEDGHYTINKIKYDGRDYDWNSAGKCFINGNDKIRVKKDDKKPDRVNLFKRTGDGCTYNYWAISWSEEDENKPNVQSLIASKIEENATWIPYPYTERDISCTQNFIKDILEKDRTDCLANDVDKGYQLLKENLTGTDPVHLTNIVNQVCLSSLRQLSYDERTTLFTLIAKQNELKEYSELALLRLMNALDSKNYKDFYTLLENNNNELIKHLVKEIDDASIWFWTDKKNYTNFIGALVTMFNQNTESVADRWTGSDDDFAQRVVNLNPIDYSSDVSMFSQRYTAKHNTGEYDSNSGKMTLYDVYTTWHFSAFSETPAKIENKEKLTEISPLTPIIIVPDKDNIPLVQAALDGYEFGSGAYVVPAIFLKYNTDKIRNDYIEKGIVITLDVATIAASGGVALATKVTWVRRAWALMEVAGAVGDIAVKIQTIDPNSDLGKAVGAYDLAMGVIGVKNVSKGVVNFAKEIPANVKTLIKENKSIRQLIVAQYLDYRIAITKLKNSDDWGNLSAEVRQNIAQQEKTFITLSDAKNLPNDNWGAPQSAFINGKTSEEILTITKYNRPDPSTYLSGSYIQQHLAKFDDGIVRFTTKSKIEQFGTLGSDECFVIPYSEYNNLRRETGNNLILIEKKLGLNSGDLTNDDAVIAFIKRTEIGEIKIPSGNEEGTIPELWLPGGRTSGGYSEAIVDLSKKNIHYDILNK